MGVEQYKQVLPADCCVNTRLGMTNSCVGALFAILVMLRCQQCSIRRAIDVDKRYCMHGGKNCLYLGNWAINMGVEQYQQL